VDGFSASNFHEKCDKIVGTLILVKSPNNNIFGAYTEANLSSYNPNNQFDPNAFLFSLSHSYNTSVKMKTKNPSNSIYSSQLSGPIFGTNTGADIGFDENMNCYSYGLDYSYELPLFLTLYETAQSFLGDSASFQPFEIEVYSILIDR